MNFLLIIFVFLFSGCSITIPHIAEYRINPKINELEYKSKECKNKSLKVMQSFSDSSLISKDMKYAQNSYQEFSFTESQWAQSPKIAINSEILKSIRESKLFDNVSGYKSRSRGDLTLESSVEEFMQYFSDDNKKSFVNIVIYMSLIDNKSLKIISSKRVSKKLNVTTLNAKGGVESLNKALRDALIETNKWLNGVCK